MILEQMSAELDLTPSFILNVASGASHEYKVYNIHKKDGGLRSISHPSRRLKALQRWLLANVIERFPVHESAAAYRLGHSILDNARHHESSRYLLRMDLADFFPSIGEGDIQQYISENRVLFRDWTTADASLFCRLVCRHSQLTIGAPTSPGLSNAILFDIDVRIHALCTKMGVNYTRYADDLFFSTLAPNVLQQIENEVKKVIHESKLPAKLRVNESKTRYSSKKGLRRVTGIVLGSDGKVHIGRGFKRHVRGLIFRLESLNAPSRASLAGMIAYATGFDPQFMNSLISKYGLARVREAQRVPSKNH